MFEVTKEQLRPLSDSDLRELVARLCVAELTERGAPSSAVKWGGSQTAPDGGLDVDCNVEDQAYRGDFVPRARTGIQVKSSEMRPSEIRNEMAPKGKIRPLFAELTRDKGCYVIVSLADDPAGTNLGDRKRSMRKQVRAIANHSDLRLEFYGRQDLANWLRNHAGVRLWVRRKLGISTLGWKPFGRWTTTPKAVSDELICKSGVVITIPGNGQQELGISEGIDEIRQLTRSSRNAIRIVGLSGIGKTRIVQALFEGSVGTMPLGPNLAIYADLGATVSPSPGDVVDQLVVDGRPAVLVLDNCPASVHSELAGVVAESESLRLITVEYDVREDKPESTDVIRVHAEGTGIAKALVLRRYPDLRQVNAERIAELAHGNARLALVLADAVDESETLSDFSDAQLFDRLFHQAGVPDSTLREAVEALSLVYSFSIEGDKDGVDELRILGGLIGHTRGSLYRSVRRLVDRQLVQKRTHWRAVLPQALSDRLAAKGLESIPVDELLAAFKGLSSPRLLISFGKRLGNLHDHEIAQEIVRHWMSPEGRLFDLGNLKDQYIKLLENVAPIAPQEVLVGIEREADKPTASAFFSNSNSHHWVFMKLLTLMAYDTDLFDRCVALLVAFASSGRGGDQHIRDHLFSLFSLYLSGTNASPEQREQAMRRFLFSRDPDEQQIGLGMLEAAIKSGHWSSIQSFEFGARPRTFGYEPETTAERDAWFERFISVAMDVAVGSNLSLSHQCRELLANNFRGLWELPALRESLTDSARKLNEHRPWLQGWRAVRSIRYLDCRDDEAKGGRDSVRLLERLDEELRPEKQADQIRAYVLGAGAQVFSMEDEFDPGDSEDWENSSRLARERARDLGKTAAHRPDVLEELWKELFTGGSAYLVEFGRGIAQELGDLQALWDQLVEWYEHVGEEVVQFGVLVGVLQEMHERHPQVAWSVLDRAAKQENLRKIIVGLHESIPLGPDGGERLSRVLDLEDVTVAQFESTIWKPGYDGLSEEERLAIMRKLVHKAAGAEVIVDGLSMALHKFKQEQRTMSVEVRRIALIAARSLLRDPPSIGYTPILGHHLSGVLNACMDEDELPTETQEVIDALFFLWNNRYGMFGGIDDAVRVIAEKCPLPFLDGVFVYPGVQEHHRYRVFRERRHSKNPLTNVTAGTLLRWCELGDFNERLMLVSSAVFPFVKDGTSGRILFSEQAQGLIEATDNPYSVLNVFSSCIHPSVIPGSLAQLIADRAEAFENLLSHERSDIRRSAKRVLVQMRELESKARKRDAKKEERLQPAFE